MIDAAVLVYDRSGLFPHVAEALIPHFTTVSYHVPWQDVTFKSHLKRIGEGIPGLLRSMHFFDDVEVADLVVFTNIGNFDLQDSLRQQGKAVWGMGQAERLEFDKVLFHEWLQGTGLDMVDMWKITGLDALEEFIKDREDLHIKGSDRGDFETFHHKKWFLTEPWLRTLKADIGPYENEVPLIVQADIDGVELGMDTWIIDGQFPQLCAYGFEDKDAGYIGTFVPRAEVPPGLIASTQAVIGWIGENAIMARGAYSSEMRLNKEGAYFIDPTMRFPSPPSQALLKTCKNWAEILYYGANGILVEPEIDKKYYAQIQLRSHWAEKHFLAVQIPTQFKDRISLHFHYMYDGIDYIVPTQDYDIIGAAVGTGDTIQEAEEEALEAAGAVEAYGLEFDKATFENLDKTLKNFRGLGYEF